MFTVFILFFIFSLINKEKTNRFSGVADKGNKLQRKSRNKNRRGVNNNPINKIRFHSVMSHALYRMGGKRPHFSLFQRRAFYGPHTKTKTLSLRFLHTRTLYQEEQKKERRRRMTVDQQQFAAKLNGCRSTYTCITSIHTCMPKFTRE